MNFCNEYLTCDLHVVRIKGTYSDVQWLNERLLFAVVGMLLENSNVSDVEEGRVKWPLGQNGPLCHIILGMQCNQSNGSSIYRHSRGTIQRRICVFDANAKR